MQTFIPYPTIAASVAHLARNRGRTNKQRQEGVQILEVRARVLGLLPPRNPDKPTIIGYRHHPAVRMWAGHERFLTRYVLAVCDACDRLGYADRVDARGKLARLRNLFDAATDCEPPWWGRNDVHESHRRALELKWAGRGDEARAGYVWPG